MGEVEDRSHNEINHFLKCGITNFAIKCMKIVGQLRDPNEVTETIQAVACHK